MLTVTFKEAIRPISHKKMIVIRKEVRDLASTVSTDLCGVGESSCVDRDSNIRGMKQEWKGEMYDRDGRTHNLSKVVDEITG